MPKLRAKKPMGLGAGASAGAGAGAASAAGASAGAGAGAAGAAGANAAPVSGTVVQGVPDAGEPMLQVRGLRAGYGDKEVVHGVSFDIPRGQFVCVIGANGCGKSTLLRNVLGLVEPFGGDVAICGKGIFDMDERERARHFAYIPQAHTPPFPFKVSDVVILGRTPYLTGLATSTSERDHLIAYRAMKQLSIEHLADAVYTELSGGQQQLVLIARALAQQPDLLVMDEPTASLDFGNQQLVLSCVYELSRMGMSVLMVTHDPDHALFCSDRVIMMEAGTIIGDGTPDQIITTENLRRIYNTESYVTDIALDNGETVRVCVPVIRTGAAGAAAAHDVSSARKARDVQLAQGTQASQADRAAGAPAAQAPKVQPPAPTLAADQANTKENR